MSCCTITMLVRVYLTAATLKKSGNAFDHTRYLLTISESEKAKLCDRARRLLSKPIKFFNEMQELFTGSSADGSLARDQNTCLGDSDGSDSADSRKLIDLNCYTQIEDPVGEDSDTLPTPTRNATVDNSSSSTSKKRPRGSKSPTKKPSKNKNRFSESADEISATMKSLGEKLAALLLPKCHCPLIIMQLCGRD